MSKDEMPLAVIKSMPVLIVAHLDMCWNSYGLKWKRLPVDPCDWVLDEY